MPAKNLYRIDEESGYSHIYNKGIENRIIFGDKEDYEAFQGFLKEYLSPRLDSESTKKAFTVNGQVFHGTPHQPKNYFGEVQLVAYGLIPDHFHLLLKQLTKGSIVSLLRSLCTRYSMYFNKKYGRTGSLFNGPYKSANIKDLFQLPPLVHHIHHGVNEYSSYPEYSGKRETAWLNIDPSVTSHEASLEDNELIAGITFESDAEYLEGRNPTVVTKASRKSSSRIPEISAMFSVFLILTGLGLRNISITSAQSISNSPIQNSEVLSESTNPSDNKVLVIVKNIDESSNINIREGPSLNSSIIGSAKGGDALEFVSLNSGWYQVKLPNGLIGFISDQYIYPDGTNN